MSIRYSGTLRRSAGVISAITKQLKSINLKPAKKIVIKFDPFHPKVKETREFSFHINTPKVLDTNIGCSVKTEVLSDRTDPSVEILLVDGKRVVFKSVNLSSLELLQLYNKHITPLAPPEEVVTAVATKASKASTSKRRR